MKSMIYLSLILTASTALAGKFEIIGEGTATKPAEYIRMDISVVSECHQSALNARQAVDQLTKNAVQILEKYKSNIPGQLSVSPEANIQKVKTTYVNNQLVVICDEDHSWTSTTMIHFKLNDLLLLAELQDNLLKLNDASVPANSLNTQRVTLSLTKPLPGVLASTWDEMSDLALQRAHQNALRQAKVLSSGMLNPSIELIKVAVTNNPSGQPIYDRVDTEGDTSGVSLGLVSLKLARQFTFKVEGK